MEYWIKSTQKFNEFIMPVLYAYGSKNANEVGSRVYVVNSKLELIVSLDNSTTDYQAEILAIQSCVRKIYRNTRY